MHTTHFRILVSCVLALFMSLSATHAGKPDKPGGGGDGGGGAAYTIIPFAPPGVSTASSLVIDVNDAGQAVGVAELQNGQSIAVHYDLDTREYHLLENGSAAGAVNNFNQIAGSYYEPSSAAETALFWESPSATPVVVLPLPEHANSYCNDMNDLGVIVGYSYNLTPPVTIGQGFVCLATVDNGGNVVISNPLPLPPLSGHVFAQANAITEFVDGTALVAGVSGDSGDTAAVVWAIQIDSNHVLETPGEPVSLGSLGQTRETSAYAINNNGTVCGTSDGQPFVAVAGEPMQALPLTRDAGEGPHFAEGINDFGMIVGELDIQVRWSQLPVHNPHAVIWANGQVQLLEKQISKQAGWSSLWRAWVINHAGVIGGQGYFDVHRRGFLMVPNN